MRESENIKIVRDTQYFKDRCDQALLTLKYHEKELTELHSMRQYCEDVQEKEVFRVNNELELNFHKTVQQEKDLKSLVGHVKLPVARKEQTSFSAFTFAYLETHDLVKLLQLSKEFRKDLLS